MSDKFKPGDLVVLNGYGIFITPVWDESFGIIISKPYSIIEGENPPQETFYVVYDILLDGQLLKMVPQEFMERVLADEEDFKRMEKVDIRNESDD